MADPQQQMTAQDFAQSVRAKYPGSYDHLSDADLTSKVVAKYPQYKSVIPNAGLADPAAPGPVANVAPTEGPLARTLTAGENRIADIHDQNTAQRQQEQHNFMTNGPIPSSIHLQNPINAIVNPEAQQRFSEGDVAGGLGETGANLAVMEAGRRVAGGEPIGTVENATAPIRGMAKAGNAVLRNPTVQKAAPYVGAAAGYGLGEIAGLPWYARVGLGSGGAAAGRAIKGGATLPGERFGLPSEPEPTPVPANEGGTVSRGSTIGASRTGAVPSPEQFIGNPTTTRPEAIPAPSKFAGGKFEPAEGPIKGTPSGPPQGVGTVAPREPLPYRGPKLGPPERPADFQEPVGPQRADTSKLGPPAGVGTYQPPERIPPPVRTTPIRTAPEPIAEKPPQVSMADQIATAKGLGFKNLGEAINRFGYVGWQKVLGQKEGPSTASVGPIGKPTPFSTPEVPEEQMYSPWGGRNPAESPEAVRSQSQREATHANMNNTPKSTSMMQFNGVPVPEVPSSPHVKPFVRETYSPETDPTLKSNQQLAARVGRQSTKQDNFENRLADAYKKRWTDEE